jgi:hypothetical protein
VAEVIIKIFELFVQTGMTPRIIHILQTSDPQRPQLQVPHPTPPHPQSFASPRAYLSGRFFCQAGRRLGPTATSTKPSMALASLIIILIIILILLLLIIINK